MTGSGEHGDTHSRGGGGADLKEEKIGFPECKGVSHALVGVTEMASVLAWG